MMPLLALPVNVHTGGTKVSISCHNICSLPVCDKEKGQEAYLTTLHFADHGPYETAVFSMVMTGLRLNP